MTKKILLAGVLAGLALFLWEFVAHDLTPLGTAGLKTLPNESATLVTLKTAVQESGFYFFPAPELRPDMTSEQKHQAMAQAEEKYKAGPSGLILINRHGAPMMMPSQLVTQLALDIASMLLVAIILSCLADSIGFGMRVGLVVLLAFLPTLRTGAPQWNWYGFPKTFIGAELIINIVGFLIAGLILAKLVQSRSRTMAAAS